jgi:pimeloyl-ACP methyl ester carboxylesterase
MINGKINDDFGQRGPLAEFHQYRVTITSGLKLGIREWGAGHLTCILLHGIGEGAFVWDDFARRISVDWRVIAIDLPGHGGSDWSESGMYDVDTLVSAVGSAMRVLKVTDFVLVGHSLGGDIAARLCADYHNDLRGLVLVDTSPNISPEVKAVVAAKMSDALRRYSTVDEFYSQLREDRFLAPAAVVERYARNALRPSDDGGLILRFDPSLLALLNSDDDDDAWWTAALRSIVAPTSLIRGQGSAVLTRGAAGRMLSFLQNGEIRVVDQAGHGVMIDNPDGFFEAMAPFLARVGKFPPMFMKK